MVLAAAVVLVVLEVICRVKFPKPSSWPTPWIRFKLDKTVGYVNLPSQKGYSMDAAVNINSRGFRGRELCERREDLGLRVLCLGNSLTFGAGVEDGETYPGQLQEILGSRLPDIKSEVINGGIVGFTITQYIPYLRKVLPEIRPDIVFLGMHWRDMHYFARLGQLKDRTDKEAWGALKKQFDKTQEKAATSTRGALLKRSIGRIRSLYVAAYYLRKLKDAVWTPNFMVWQRLFLRGEVNEHIIARERFARERLGLVSGLCESANARFILLLFPDNKQLLKEYPDSIWPSIVSNICRDKNIMHLELRPALSNAYAEHRGSLFVPYDITHYSPEGNRAIAEAIFDFIQGGRLTERQIAALPEGMKEQRSG
jgi:hypothetical protein